MNAVEGAGSRGVGRVRFIVGLNVGPKRMLAVGVVIQRKMCDDGMR